MVVSDLENNSFTAAKARRSEVIIIHDTLHGQHPHAVRQQQFISTKQTLGENEFVLVDVRKRDVSNTCY